MSRIKQLLHWYKDDPTDEFLCFALAKEYEKEGEYVKAFEYYSHLVKAHPSYIGTYYHLGKLYELHQKFAEAISAYTEGLAQAELQNDHKNGRELQEALAQLKHQME